MPRAAEGEFSWTQTTCSPIASDPAEPGEACTAENAGLSGVDDCGAGALCWEVDPTTDAGTCVALCLGTPASPICEDPNTQCVILDDLLILCLHACDPITQSCGRGRVCTFIEGVFACTPSLQTKAGPGDPCAFENDCDPGSFCADASTVPGCTSETCCSHFCDLTAADPDAPCSLDGQTCVPWYAPGMAPPGLAHVGACALP
ncbi:MAG: hypothetical protein JNK45_28405 [Myxococcales bacterium]|nr:hypothetical protein [Myxococcales bacterium]